MKLFLDNTGLHSVGRCLDGYAKGELDIAGLLQFATQLVFSDQLFYAAFCSAGVTARSQRVNEQVSELGVGSEVLCLSPSDAVSYERAGLSAAERLAGDLKFAFVGTTTESVPIATCLPDLNPLRDRGYGKIHRALEIGNDSSRSELSVEGADMRLVGSAARLVTMSDNLWLQASRLARSKSWKKEDTAKLVALLRCYLNQELAMLLSQSEHDSVNYCPSVARARIIEGQDAYVLSKLTELIGEAAQKLDRIKLEAPPVALALALRAKGDPKAVITEALVARESATELRRYLREVIDAAKRDAATLRKDLRNDAEIDCLRKAVKRLASLLEQELHIAQCPEALDAFEGLMVGPVPIPTPRKVKDWIRNKHDRPRITILSEFAKTVANPTSDKFALKKLYANCQRNAKLMA